MRNFLSWLHAMDKAPKGGHAACGAEDPDNCRQCHTGKYSPEAKEDVVPKNGSDEERLEQEARKVDSRYLNADGTRKTGWLVAPNGKQSNLDERQWVMVRTEQFKKWFGDWESALRLDRKRVNEAWDFCMNGRPVAYVEDGLFRAEDGRDPVDVISEFYQREFNGEVKNPEKGAVKLNKKGVKSSMASLHGGLYRAKFLAFGAVPEVIRNGIIFDESSNWKNRGDRTFVIAAPIEIVGKPYYCEVVICEKFNSVRGGGMKSIGNTFYLQNVFLIEKEKEKASQACKNPAGGLTREAVAQPTSSILAKDHYTVNGGVSSFVDGNGEPKVVHGRADGKPFSEFESDIGKGEQRS